VRPARHGNHREDRRTRRLSQSAGGGGEQDTRRTGNITVHRHIQLSADGKTMTVTANGTTGGGQKYANDIRVYEKQ
jgi:hypothetical protein